MTKQFRLFTIVLSLALVLMACQLAQQLGGEKSAKIVNTSTANLQPKIPTDKPSQTQETRNTVTQMAEEGDPAFVVGEKPPQSQAAGILPKDMRVNLTHLSNLMGYLVLDANGEKLGIASDYIVNTCETYIIYILMEPVASLDIGSGALVVIPFEAVTINSGVLDAQNKTIQLQLIPEQLSDAPTLAADQQLTPTEWEDAVRAFWEKLVRIGMLATSCNVPGGPVYKVAYASQLLKVELYDGLNNLLGVVQEAILEPESGKLGFYIVKPAKGDGLVMVRLGVINIPKEMLSQGSVLTLVLTADPQVFWDAPRINNIEEADDIALQSKMRQYWGR